MSRPVLLKEAHRAAKKLLTPNSKFGNAELGETYGWELARAQWHWDYGSRALAERLLKDINMRRALYRSEGRPNMEPLELKR